MRTITRSRMCKECEECPYKSNCNNKRLVAEMAIVPNMNTMIGAMNATMPNININNSVIISQIVENINKNICGMTRKAAI